jgi:hypothetical protein
MLVALALTAALALTPTASTHQANDYDNPLDTKYTLVDTPISFYQGRMYVKKDNQLRYCIRYRESRHAYSAKSDTGKYRGAYQMSREFKNGMAWMIQKELRETGTPKAEAVKVGEILRGAPVNKWNPYYQDFAFWMGWDNGKGASHWAQTGRSAKC